MLRKPADPEEELRWISQEVRGYVEAVLSSLAANVPKLSILDLVNLSNLTSSSVLLLLFNRLLFFAKLRRQRKTCLISSILP
jgi:dynamin GTPase